MKEPLIYQGANTVSLFARLIHQNKKKLPLRSSEIGLLIYTVKSTEPVTPVMAATYFKVSKPMITAMVKTLAKEGYVIKTPSPSDKRSYLLTPTEKAKTFTKGIYEEYFRDMQLLLDSLGPARFSQLIQLIEEANDCLVAEKRS